MDSDLENYFRFRFATLILHPILLKFLLGILFSPASDWCSLCVQDGRYVGADGEGGRVVVDGEGGLSLRGVRKEEGGRYQCIAENLAGGRETPPVRLGVHGKNPSQIYFLPSLLS